MPTKPYRQCNNQLCGELTTDKYCDMHKEDEQKDKTEANRYYDTYIRDEQSTKFYNSKEWRSLRELVKSKCHGLCVKCYEENRLRAGHIADHIVPIKIDWTLRLVESNIQYLCIECHNTKTAEDIKKYNEGRGISKIF